MGEVLSAYYAFNSSAGNAVTLIAGFSSLPKVPDSLRIDIPRIGHLEKLANEIEKALADAQRVLEEVPSLTALDDLKTRLSALQEQYKDCFQQWRREGGRELTPPRLWRRLRNVEKALKKLYEDCLDVEDFRAAKEEWEREGRKTVPWEKIKADLGL
jgi:hypothetical protein